MQPQQLKFLQIWMRSSQIPFVLFFCSYNGFHIRIYYNMKATSKFKIIRSSVIGCQYNMSKTFYICPFSFLFQVWNVSHILQFPLILFMDNALFDLSDNPLLSSKVTVTIKVLDVNEFPPELAFVYETFVCENAKVGQVRMCVWITTCASIWVSWPVVGCCSELMWENCALIFSFHAERELLPVQRCLSVSPYSVFYTRERSSLAYMRKCAK